MLADGLGHASHGHLPGVFVGEKGGDVVKQNPRLGEIGDRPDVIFYVHGGVNLWGKESPDVAGARAPILQSQSAYCNRLPPGTTMGVCQQRRRGSQ